ncbi:MAG: rRNA maturation RNase YbeY [Candidatus Andersenbacteria bacterium]
MPVTLHCKLPLSTEEVSTLWLAVIRDQSKEDSEVAVSCASKEEIKQLNMKYRGKDKATNVLTFSYDEQHHDIAICLSVAQSESKAREMTDRDYVALLLVHAFLHATGLDHEVSSDAQVAMEQAEKNVLTECGFSAASL